MKQHHFVWVAEIKIYLSDMNEGGWYSASALLKGREIKDLEHLVVYRMHQDKSNVKRGEKRLKKYKTNYSDWL